MHWRLLVMGLVVSTLFGVSARAQLRCDCATQQGDCSAQVSWNDGLLELTTDTASCAQVLFYIDGQPHVSVVTDGRAVEKLALDPFQTLAAGTCRVCTAVSVSAQQKMKVALQCEPDYLLTTERTASCLSTCGDIDNGKERGLCKHNCQQYSRCLEPNCVQALRNRYAQCERQCDREMQSSMAADIDAYRTCHAGCKAIEAEIQSCPVL